MAMFEGSSEDRTESPSQYRREEFRRQGTVALSRELLSVAVLLGVGTSLYVAGNLIHTQFSQLAHQFFEVSRQDLTKHEVIELGQGAFHGWILMVAPVFAVAMLVGIAASIAQVGFYVSWEPLSFKWERLNPIEGLQRLASASSLVEAAKALFKMAIASLVVWHFVRSHAQEAGMFFTKSVPELLPLTLSWISKLFFSLLAAFSALAALDYAFQRYRIEKQMRMTKQEAKEEFKLREGDPLIKARIKQVQRRMASRRMMEAVPKADVVITNPTHLAVALKYDPETMNAPKVVAKGADEVAKKIRELARFHQVPLVENKPLARTLYKEIEVGGSIPRELYKAVAEVLAYVFRLRGRAA